MSQPRRLSGRRRKIVLYSIPLIALSILAAAYYEASLPLTPRVDFTFELSIKISTLQNQTSLAQFVVAPPIGVPGGIWATHIYQGFGLDGKYPVYTEAPPNPYPDYSIIHVRSLVNRTYYLGDFFAVWGNQVGPSNTLGLTTPPPSWDTRFGSDWYWVMCAGPNVSHMSLGLWAKEPLTPHMLIILIYSNLDPPCA